MRKACKRLKDHTVKTDCELFRESVVVRAQKEGDAREAALAQYAECHVFREVCFGVVIRQRVEQRAVLLEAGTKAPSVASSLLEIMRREP